MKFSIYSKISNRLTRISPIRLSPIGHSPLEKVTRVYWRKYSGLSPIGQSHRSILAKLQWTFAIDKCLVGESLIGEIRESHSVLQVVINYYFYSIILFFVVFVDIGIFSIITSNLRFCFLFH